MIYIVIFFIVSLIVNIFLFWYMKGMLDRLLYVSENIGIMNDSLEDFREHLSSLYQMETFYGEPTIENLINHSREVLADIERFKEIYELTEEEEVDDIEEDATIAAQNEEEDPPPQG